MGTIRSDQIIATVSALLSVVLFIVGGEYLIRMNPIHAQEHGPITELRRINAAEVTYSSGSGGYFAGLQDLIDEGLLDARFTEPIDAYLYEIVLEVNEDGRGESYVAAATPVPNEDASRLSYYSGVDGIVRYGAVPYIPALMSIEIPSSNEVDASRPIH